MSRWRREFDDLLGTMTDKDVALRAGVSPQTARVRRRVLGISAFKAGNTAGVAKSQSLRGKTYHDLRERGWDVRRIADEYEVTAHAVYDALRKYYARLDTELGLQPSTVTGARSLDAEQKALLGTLPDHRVAVLVGRHASTVARLRRRLGISASPRQRTPNQMPRELEFARFRRPDRSQENQ